MIDKYCIPLKPLPSKRARQSLKERKPKKHTSVPYTLPVTILSLFFLPPGLPYPHRRHADMTLLIDHPCDG
ncbi:hypothetical protein BGS_0519 [Beggiatoa sp. SS]|nr:hypothetical protein BGS_0519 [Beggiatoa sp. SS]